jgi:hypothetical protein
MTRDDIGPTTPILLETAARLAFPDGAMTALILRRRAARGQLAIEKIGNRVYTTLAAIEEMRALCRSNPKALDSGSGADGKARTESASTGIGSSKTTEMSVSPLASALHVAESLRLKLKTPSRDTSLRSGKSRANVTALRPRSQSRT